MGSFSDPDVVPGLAHFLEHSKYPAALKVASKIFGKRKREGEGAGGRTHNSGKGREGSEKGIYSCMLQDTCTLFSI